MPDNMQMEKGEDFHNTTIHPEADTIRGSTPGVSGGKGVVQKEKHQQRTPNADSELKRVNAQFNALVSASVDHVYMLDHAGTFLFSNDRVQQFGFRWGRNLVGKHLHDVFPRQTSRLFHDKLNEVIREKRLVLFNHHLVTGKSAWHFADSLYPIIIDQQVHAVGGICHDISHHKIIENQLLQAQKMEALGTLVAGVAHEINNPINLILFNLPLLKRIWDDLLPVMAEHAGQASHCKMGGLTHAFIQANLPRLISDMGMAAERVVRIVNGLKDFSRKITPAEASLVSVNQAAENAAVLVGATLKKSLTELSFELETPPPLLCACINDLEQIIVNLIINAVQSIDHPHGKINLSTSTRPKDHCIVLEVADNGKGVNPAVAEKIFDPFVTDRQADGGTGLGLSVTYNLVKALNGEISFKTALGKGTTFTVVIPPDIQRKRKKVMVVDDDRMFRGLLIDSLSEKVECEVEGFENGAEALIRLGSQPPDMLILDMFMPEIDGLGVCRAIQNELDLELTKVIIVTGFPDHPNIHEAARMGFVQIFTKPLEVEKFIQKVQAILHGKP